MEKRERSTPKQIDEKSRRAEELIATGKPINKSLKEVELSEPSFRRWRKKQRNGEEKTERPRSQKITATSFAIAEPTITLSGTPAQLADFIKGLK